MDNLVAELKKSVAIARAIAEAAAKGEECKIGRFNPEEFVFTSPFRRLRSSWNGHGLAACRRRPW